MKSKTRHPAPHGRALLAGCGLALGCSLFAAAPASAQTGPEILLEPFPKELRLDASASAMFQDTGHSKQTGDDIRLDTYETSGRLRLFPGDLASPRIGYDFKYLDTNSSIPGLPRRLADMSVGFATPVAKYEDWVFAVSGAVGYAGDSFFGDGDAYYGKANVVAFKQLNQTDALAFGVSYDGNRTYKPDVPFPGFAYIKRVREDLLLTLGVPLTSVEWEPIPHLRVEATYVLVDNFRARVGYEVLKGLEVYGSAGLSSDGFYLDGLRHNDDRLLFQQKHAEVGITWRTKDAGVGDSDFTLTAAVGYAWDGEFSTGFDQSNSKLLADISDTPYVRFGLQWKF